MTQETHTIDLSALPEAEKSYARGRFPESLKFLQTLLYKITNPAFQFHNNYIFLLMSIAKYKSSVVFEQCGFVIATIKFPGRHAQFIQAIVDSVRNNVAGCDDAFAIVSAFLKKTSYQEADLFSDLFNTSQELSREKRHVLSDKIDQIFLSLIVSDGVQLNLQDRVSVMGLYIKLAEKYFAQDNRELTISYFDRFHNEYLKLDGDYDVTIFAAIAFNIRAEVAIDDNDAETALKYLAKARKMNKKDARIDVNEAAVIFLRGEHETAFKQLQDLLPRCDSNNQRCFKLFAKVCVAVLMLSSERLEDCRRVINRLDIVRRHETFRALFDHLLVHLSNKNYREAGCLIRLMTVAIRNLEGEFNGTYADLSLLVSHLPSLNDFDPGITELLAKLMVSNKQCFAIEGSSATASSVNELMAIASFYSGNYSNCYKELNKILSSLSNDNQTQARSVYIKSIARLLVQAILLENGRDSSRLQNLTEKLMAFQHHYSNSTIIFFCRFLIDYANKNYQQVVSGLTQLDELAGEDNYCHGVAVCLVASSLYRMQEYVRAWQVYARAVRHHHDLLLNFPQLQQEVEDLERRLRYFPRKPFKYTAFFQHQESECDPQVKQLVENFRASQMSSAVAVLSIMSKIEPVYPHLDFYFGVLFHLLGDYKKAISNYMQMQQSQPDNFRTTYNLEIALIQLEESERPRRGV